MHTRHLGTSGLVSSATGLGCMGFSQGYGPADDDASIQTIHRSLDLGVTMLDTSMSYGQGHNERLVGRAIAGRREQVLLATKFGIVRDDQGARVDGRPENVRAYCDASLTRLGVDTIDLYYLHRIDPNVPVAETVGAMADLVRDGKVRHLGVSEATPGDLDNAAATHRIAAVQFEWSLLWREPEDDVVPTARRLGIGMVPYSPVGRGMLTGLYGTADIEASHFRSGDPRFQGAELDRNADRAKALHDIAAESGISAGQLALAWLLAQGDDVVPIPGTRHADRAAENVAAADIELSDADLQRLEDEVPRATWAGDRSGFAAPVTTRAPR